MQRKLLPGRPYPLGAKANSRGTNFALYSEHATGVLLCLFDEAGKQTECIPLRERTAFVWHGLVLGIKPGQLYGYRVDGPWEPEKGFRFNPNKLLVDPYAEAISGELDWKAPIFPYDLASGDDSRRDDQDSAAGVPKSVVVDASLRLGQRLPAGDAAVRLRDLRGAREGLLQVQPQRAGETARNLCRSGAPGEHRLPEGARHHRGRTAADPRDDRRRPPGGTGLRDYWGYNTLGYFAPAARYSSTGDHGGQVHEFKEMVKALHAAGIEVILDVVYNHTCEGNHMGPMLSFKGV